MAMPKGAGASYCVAALMVVCTGFVFAACSSSPAAKMNPTPPTTSPARTGPARTGPAGSAVLGATLQAWKASHVPATVGTTAGYGSAIIVNGRKVPEFTSLQVRDGKVVGWHLSFGPATRLATAENLVRELLPEDAQQTASWKGSFRGADRYCEFVNFRSKKLAEALGTGAPQASGNIGASIYDSSSAGRTGTPSIEVVNSADVSTRVNVQGHKC
jgi:hypothetical protein